MAAMAASGEKASYEESRDDLDPVLLPGRFVFVDEGALGRIDPRSVMATVREPEGLSGVIPQDSADQLGIDYDFIGAWIVLGMETDLGDLGITVAISTRLAELQISCNVIAGLRHDHILVPAERATEALEAIRGIDPSSRST